MRFTLVPWSLGQWTSLFNLSQLPLRSIQPRAAAALRKLFHSQYQPLPSQVPIYTPEWREAVIVKYLAQGHQVSRPGFKPTLRWISTRTWIDHALTSSSRHLRGNRVTKQSRRTDLYARRTVLSNEQHPFDLYVRAPYWNDVMCIRSIQCS